MWAAKMSPRTKNPTPQPKVTDDTGLKKPGLTHRFVVDAIASSGTKNGQRNGDSSRNADISVLIARLSLQ